MSKKTIAKFFLFVIQALFLSLILPACSKLLSDQKRVVISPRYGPPFVAGRLISPDIVESSGIAASRCQNDIFWTHNDSGDDAFIFAFGRNGEHLGAWGVQNAVNRDWEDIALIKDKNGKCFLYIGEIGDNKNRWPVLSIYRIPEPEIMPEHASSSPSQPLATDPAEVLQFRYPDGARDAETLMVHPQTMDIYVLSKLESGPAGVYRIKPIFQFDRIQTAEKIADITVPAVPNGLLTGGDIAPDGRRLVVCDYLQAYEFSLPTGVDDFEEIWRQSPEAIDLGKRKAGEAIGYSSDGSAIYATSEGPNSPLITVRTK